MHREAYILEFGPIPDDLVIDHKCRFTLCVNPYHLEPVTQAENVLRGESIMANNARKTHCSKGHALTDDNVRLVQQKSGNFARQCILCQQNALREWRRNNRARIQDQRTQRTERDRQQRNSPWMQLFKGRSKCDQAPTHFICLRFHRKIGDAAGRHNTESGIYTPA